MVGRFNTRQCDIGKPLVFSEVIIDTYGCAESAPRSGAARDALVDVRVCAHDSYDWYDAQIREQCAAVGGVARGREVVHPSS